MRQIYRSLVAYCLFECHLWAAQSAASLSGPDLSGFSRSTLISCFSNFTPCESDSWSIADELKKRGHTAALFESYWKVMNPAARAGIEKVAYREDSPEARKFLRQVVARQINDGEDLYYPFNDLAKHCEEAGLQALATGRYRNQGSLQYATSLRLFGMCGYRPAIPYLVNTALSDASLNVIDAAEDSLRKLYPKAPSNFPDLASMQRYFCAQAKEEGFEVRCAAKIPPAGHK